MSYRLSRTGRHPRGATEYGASAFAGSPARPERVTATPCDGPGDKRWKAQTRFA